MSEGLFRFIIVAAVGWLYVPARYKRDPICHKIMLVIVIGYSFQYFLREPLYRVIGDWYDDWRHNRSYSASLVTDADIARYEAEQAGSRTFTDADLVPGGRTLTDEDVARDRAKQRYAR